MSKAPIRNGSNTGTRRYTDSNENDETLAMFPVPKKPVCNNTKKNKAILASESTRFRKGREDGAGIIWPLTPLPFERTTGPSVVAVATFVSSSLQRTSVMKKVR